MLPADGVLTEEVYCLPAYRGRGLAPALLQATGLMLLARGKRRAWAYLDTTNIPALRMFNRAGYLPTGEERVDRYRGGRFETLFRAATPQTLAEWEATISGSRERIGLTAYLLRAVDPSSFDSIGSEFVLRAALKVRGRRQNATSGEPVESKLVLYADRFTEIGIWEVTPGSLFFPASKDGVCELMQFVAGSATIVDANGETRVEPGIVMFRRMGGQVRGRPRNGEKDVRAPPHEITTPGEAWPSSPDTCGARGRPPANGSGTDRLTSREAANSAPRTKRESGPNRFSAA